MDKVIMVQNDMSQEGQRCLHVMSNDPYPPALSPDGRAPSGERGHTVEGKIAMVFVPAWAKVKEWEDELRLHHLTATWMAREAMYYTFRREGNGKNHPVVVWATPISASATRVAETADGGLRPPRQTPSLTEEHRPEKGSIVSWDEIKVAAVDAAIIFFGTFDYWPRVVWVRNWPKGLKEEDAFIPLGKGFGLDLIAVQWAMDGFVIVGGGLSATHVAEPAEGGLWPPRPVNQKRS